jgi:hypothetical protein
MRHVLKNKTLKLFWFKGFDNSIPEPVKVYHYQN